MHNTSTASLDNAQRLTRTASFIIVTTSCSISVQSAILLRLHCLSVVMFAPSSCLSLLNPAPRSLGFSSSTQSGRCSSNARSCAAQGHMSACRTRPAANPGGPQGGAQTGRRWGGGGAGRKLSRPGFETKCCRAFRQPCQDRLHGSRTDTRRPDGSQNSEQITNYKCITLYNHIYNCLFIHMHN